MSEDAQILIARLLSHQTLERRDRLVKQALSDEVFRLDVDQRLASCGLKLVDNVYADHVTLALAREVEPKVFGAREVWQNNNMGLGRDGVALLVVLWALIILPKRERQQAHQEAQVDQDDMFAIDKPMPRAQETSIGLSYRTLLADFGDKLGRKTRMDMNLGQLARFGFIERRNDDINEGPLLDLLMDTDMLKERVVNGALADLFQRQPKDDSDFNFLHAHAVPVHIGQDAGLDDGLDAADIPGLDEDEGENLSAHAGEGRAEAEGENNLPGTAAPAGAAADETP